MVLVKKYLNDPPGVTTNPGVIQSESEAQSGIRAGVGWGRGGPRERGGPFYLLPGYGAYLKVGRSLDPAFRAWRTTMSLGPIDLSKECRWEELSFGNLKGFSSARVTCPGLFFIPTFPVNF